MDALKSSAKEWTRSIELVDISVSMQLKIPKRLLINRYTEYNSKISDFLYYGTSLTDYDEVEWGVRDTVHRHPPQLNGTRLWELARSRQVRESQQHTSAAGSSGLPQRVARRAVGVDAPCSPSRPWVARVVPTAPAWHHNWGYSHQPRKNVLQKSLPDFLLQLSDDGQ